MKADIRRGTVCKVAKVIDKNNVPKYRDWWMKTVVVCADVIVVGYGMMFYIRDDRKWIMTSNVLSVKIDDTNIVVETENSTYYLKKVL